MSFNAIQQFQCDSRPANKNRLRNISLNSSYYDKSETRPYFKLKHIRNHHLSITFLLLFQVEFYTMYHVRCVVIIVRENTMESSLVMGAPDFSNDQYVVIEIMCANRNPKDFASSIKHIGTNVERVVYANVLMLA